ncbi:MAG: AmmeMemoRadiSam system protein B [Clostridiaceae bacterium]|jgi:AmmeMemoRadiSam system protein B/AmmeMemoRadiSam system protein A|nr:AmmeMemoRadiSam system protein B [Clostridiaceae bacterium]
MNKIKSPSVAGSFYTANKDELEKQLEYFKGSSINQYEYKSRAVIVPHAGLVYSGELAYSGLQSLDKGLKTLIIFAPSHHVAFDGLVLSSYDAWETPFGKIKIDKDINNELNKNFRVEYNDEAFETEHSIEVQLPAIQTLYKDIKIVPILVGRAKYEDITGIINNYWSNKNVGFVISSDLSHFYKCEEAEKIDSVTAQMIESNEIHNFQQGQACGYYGILGLLNFAEKEGFSLIRIGLRNSSFVTGDKSNVVGYGTWMLYEGNRNEFLKKYYSDKILEICKNAIFAGLEHIHYKAENIPAVFYESGACFVTLEEEGNLRGCIGSIIAHRIFIDDLIHNAQNAAFSDPRFNPVCRVEYKDLSIAVSILSMPVEMTFEDEDDLLSQLVPNKDGLIINDGEYQAVYLPSVWEQLPDKKDFLNSLKVKAGLPKNHFSKTFVAYRFYCEYIK